MEKVQTNLNLHLLEEANHRFAGSTPALVDVHNCRRQGTTTLTRQLRACSLLSSLPPATDMLWARCKPRGLGPNMKHNPPLFQLRNLDLKYAWWLTTVISTLGRQRQENQVFKTILNYLHENLSKRRRGWDGGGRVEASTGGRRNMSLR